MAILPETAPPNGSDVAMASGIVGLPMEAFALLADGPPMYVSGLDGRLTYANAAYQRLLVQAARNHAANDEHASKLALEEIICDVTVADGAISREDVVETENGAEFYSSQHFPVRDGAGKIVAVGGIYQNATREAQAWLETLAARERFRDVTRLVVDWVWETDTEFNFTFVSARVAEALKVHPRSLIGTSLFAVGTYKPEESGVAPSPLQSDMRSPFRDVTYEIVNGEGENRLFLLSGLPVFNDKSGAFKGFRGTARDITAEVEAKVEAYRSQTRLSSAIESISEGFGLRNGKGALLLTNSKFDEFFAGARDKLRAGAPLSEALAAAKDTVVAERSHGELDAWIAALRQAGEPLVPFELSLRNGRWIRVTETRTSRGGMVSIVNDISESKQREEMLIGAKLSAEEANRFKGEFLANMSHELRTPLNAIIGFSEIMGAETFGKLGNDRYREYAKDILDSSRHLLGIINDILDISKADAGKLQLFEEEVNLGQEVRDAMRLFAEHAADVRVKLTTDLPDDLVPLWADRRKLKQILLNLLSNAIKFTPHGGEVRTSVSCDRQTGDLLIAVSDTGIGIADKDKDKVFSAFGQVESSLSRRYEGTGLGLPLSVALVELHGGSLDLQSKVGVGTTITVRLPYRRLHRDKFQG